MAKKQINLALQGGGAHGAFTWGVLDRLLEEDELEVCAISGTSAGALNGAAFKAGTITGGRQGARDNLDWLWERVAGWAGCGRPSATPGRRSGCCQALVRLPESYWYSARRSWGQRLLGGVGVVAGQRQEDFIQTGLVHGKTGQGYAQTAETGEQAGGAVGIR